VDRTGIQVAVRSALGTQSAHRVRATLDRIRRPVVELFAMDRPAGWKIVPIHLVAEENHLVRRHAVLPRVPWNFGGDPGVILRSQAAGNLLVDGVDVTLQASQEDRHGAMPA